MEGLPVLVKLSLERKVDPATEDSALSDVKDNQGEEETELPIGGLIKIPKIIAAKDV